MDKKKSIILAIVVLTIVMISGVSFALWQITLKQESTNVITTGCFKIEFQDENPISLENAFPITNEEGKNLVPYSFTITNTCDSVVSYQVNLEVLESSTLEHLEIIDVLLNETEKNLTSDNEVVKTLSEARNAYQLEIGSLKAKESVTYHLRLWMDENTSAEEIYMNKIFQSKITVTLTHQQNIYTEPLLNGMDPVLKDELIPVTIENDGTVHKADTELEWYRYENQEWANAVILKDETKEYQNNEVILEDDIESYFVWIPKYRYQLWNLEEYDGLTEIDTKQIHTIPVIFGDYNTKDEVEGECTTPMTSGNIGNCKEGDYMTHPAFLSIPSTGFWVGKFETSKGNENADNSINPGGVQIKPNQVSWRNIQVANAFYTTYDYKRNLDSHMMKNTEWGAVAYLSHSSYGSHKSVRINNNSDFITGYASVNEPECGWTNDNQDCNKYGTTEDVTLSYKTDTGVFASTTGNISGIYDMSGGSWEYVMGVMADESDNPLSGRNTAKHSGFRGVYGEGGSADSGQFWPEEKYYDKYKNGIIYTEFTGRILGDATGEMGPYQSVTYGIQTGRQISSWYKNHSCFILSTIPWFRLGGAFDHGTEAGMFAFGRDDGFTDSESGFRVILTPKL